MSRSVAQVNSFASFLLGAPTTLGKTLVTIIPYTSRNWEYSFYIRDRWHVNPKLTLSYGLRWEYFQSLRGLTAAWSAMILTSTRC